MPKVTVLAPKVMGAEKMYSRGECDMTAADIKLFQASEKDGGRKVIEVHKPKKAAKK